MKFWKKNDGLTLVELMVSIAIGSMILLATVTVLLLGFRIQHNTTKSVTQQYTARTVVTLLENMATEGSFNGVVREKDGSWRLGILKESDGELTNQEENVGKRELETVLLSYKATSQTVYTGDYDKGDATPMLENIVASYILWSNNVLTISIQDPNQTYLSSVFCRLETVDTGKTIEDEKTENMTEDTSERGQFINLLLSQLGTRGGIINDNTRICKDGDYCGQGCFVFDFFSEWYIGGYENNSSWNANTPWCACFVSWGLAHTDLTEPEDNWFANVDLFMDYFTSQNKDGAWKVQTTDGVAPNVGDIVFFNMISDDKNDPSHVGVVIGLSEDKKNIRTIEGNSADMVAIREYPINDPRILGYGDPWAAQQGNS